MAGAREHETDGNEAEAAAAAAFVAPAPAVEALRQGAGAGPVALRALASVAGNRSMARLVRSRMLARDDGKPAPPKPPPAPVDYVFIMGKTMAGGTRNDAFYVSARKHYVDMKAVPGATVVEAASLEEIVDTVAGGPGPVRNLYIVVHATPIGVEFGLKKGDSGSYGGRIWLDKLQPESAALGATIAPKVDDKTVIRIRGCNVGRNKKFIAELHKALGGKGTLEAPTHRTSYDWETTGATVTSTREYATEFALIFPDKPEHKKYKPADLAPMFAAKYPDSGISDATWLKILEKVKPGPVVKSYQWDVDTDPKTQYTDDEIADVMKGNINEPSEFFYSVARPSKAKAIVTAKQLRYEVPTKEVEKVTGVKRDLAKATDKDYGTFMTTDVAPATTPAAKVPAGATP